MEIKCTVQEFKEFLGEKDKSIQKKIDLIDEEIKSMNPKITLYMNRKEIN